MSTELPLLQFYLQFHTWRGALGCREHRWSCSHKEAVNHDEMQQPHGSHHLTLRPLASHRAIIL